MIYLLIYIAFCIAGGFYGRHLRKKGKTVEFSDKIQTGVLILLLVIMGAKMGANEEVIKNLGNLGFVALIFTAFVLAGALGMTFLARKLLKMNKKGEQDD